MSISHEEFITHEMRRVRCDCGGPANGTGHAPDCQYVLGLEDAEELWDEAVYEEAIASIVPQ